MKLSYPIVLACLAVTLSKTMAEDTSPPTVEPTAEPTAKPDSDDWDCTPEPTDAPTIAPTQPPAGMCPVGKTALAVEGDATYCAAAACSDDEAVCVTKGSLPAEPNGGCTSDSSSYDAASGTCMAKNDYYCRNGQCTNLAGNSGANVAPAFASLFGAAVVAVLATMV
jgi:hypothetical protein